MIGYARSEDGGEAPINLGAFDVEDVKICSAMVQDAVLPVTEIKWYPKHCRLGLLLNRLRWEGHWKAKWQGREIERVQSLLLFEYVFAVASHGFDRKQHDLVLCVLSLDVDLAKKDVNFILTLAGGGAIKVTSEAIEITLKDVSRPYLATSGTAPRHPD